MKAPIVLFVIFSSFGVLGTIVPVLSDVLLLAVPCAIASLWLLWRVWRRPKWAIVDGSNVMHWKDGVPDINALRDVLKALKRKGYTAGVMFDANAGYKLIDKYLHDDAFSKVLKLPEDRIMVVPKGTPADPYILKAARDLGARIVTNDQFRDWVDEYPEVKQNGFLITGQYLNGRLSLSF